MREEPSAAPGWLVRRCSSGTALAPSVNEGSARLAARPMMWFHRPPAFLVREGAHQLLGSPEEGSAKQAGSHAPIFYASITSDCFRVRDRRQNMQQLATTPVDLDREIEAHYLQFFSSSASRVASVVTGHLLPNTNVIAAGLAAWVGGSKRLRHEQQEKGRGGHEASAAARANAEARKLAERALMAERQGDPEQAAALYTQLVALKPEADSYARLSKQYTDMAYLDGITRERVVELNSRAVELAGQAVELDPGHALGHIARCVSRGRLALVSDNRAKIQLAKDAAEDAAIALRLDPNSDLAHHLMGRWHYEMAQINAVARYLIRVFFGTNLMVGTYPEALVHYRTAAHLCPERIIHRVEIGRTLIKLGNHKEAEQELEQAVGMEVEDINAMLQREGAAATLAQLRATHDKRGMFGMGLPAAADSAGAGNKNPRRAA